MQTSPDVDVDEIIEATRLAGRLLAISDATELERLGRPLFALVYLGLYARRARSYHELRSTNCQNAPIDFQFVRSVRRNVKGDEVTNRFPVVSVDEGGVVVRHLGLLARQSGFVETTFVEACFPGVKLWQAPGFLSRVSAVSLSPQTSRIYLAVKPGQAAWFLEQLFERLTSKLDAVAIKVLANPRNYFRTDAAVIYVDTENLEMAARIVKSSIDLDRIVLRSNAPLGTKKVCSGIGWADSPSSETEPNISFGQWISAVIIEAAQKHGQRCTMRDLAAIVEKNGRSIARLHRR